MKKLRRFLTVLLFINFSWGMATGMEPLNFWLVMANGTAVIGLAGTSKEVRTIRTAGNQYFEWVSCQRLHSNKRKGVCRE